MALNFSASNYPGAKTKREQQQENIQNLRQGFSDLGSGIDGYRAWKLRRESIEEDANQRKFNNRAEMLKQKIELLKMGRGQAVVDPTTGQTTTYPGIQGYRVDLDGDGLPDLFQDDNASVGISNVKTPPAPVQTSLIDPSSGQVVNTVQGKPAILPQPKNSIGGKKDVQQAMDLYETARDGLLSGLEGSKTGPFSGRLPAITAAQQTAEGGVAAMAPVLKQLFRVAGEGVFTDKDQELLINMVPTRKDAPEARKAKIENIDNIVKAKLGFGKPQGAPTGDNIVDTREEYDALPSGAIYIDSNGKRARKR